MNQMPWYEKKIAINNEQKQQNLRCVAKYNFSSTGALVTHQVAIGNLLPLLLLLLLFFLIPGLATATPAVHSSFIQFQKYLAVNSHGIVCHESLYNRLTVNTFDRDQYTCSISVPESIDSRNREES